MKVTLVGGILIAAAVIAGVLLILALNEKRDGLNRKQSRGSQPDQSSQPGTCG